MKFVGFLYLILNKLAVDLEICKTPECVTSANVLKMNMISIHPADKPIACENFYNYACAGFKKSYRLTPQRRFVTMYEYLEENTNEKLADLLSQNNRAGEPPHLQKARHYYQECISLNRENYFAIKNCIREVTSLYPRVILYLLVKATEGYKTKKKIKKMLQNIKASFTNKINKSWLDRDARLEITEHIKKLKTLIFFNDDVLDPRNFDKQFVRRPFDFLAESCAYVPAYHIIGIPVALNNMPFYKHGLESMDYGGIGFGIAHELSHIHDDRSRYINVNSGTFKWWTKEIERKFREKAQMFVPLYNQFTVDGVDRKVNVDGVFTQTENIQDNVGFELALNAYRTHATKEQKLKGLESFSAEQLFTLAFANLFCENAAPEHNENRIYEDPHSPGEARVNGVAMNSKDFSKIWNCRPNSPMNPPVKYDIWS